MSEEQIQEWFTDFDTPVTPEWVKALSEQSVAIDASMRSDIINTNCQVLWQRYQVVPPITVKQRLAERLCDHFPSLRAATDPAEVCILTSIRISLCQQRNQQVLSKGDTWCRADFVFRSIIQRNIVTREILKY